jgi:hypothetical protein
MRGFLFWVPVQNLMDPVDPYKVRVTVTVVFCAGTDTLPVAQDMRSWRRTPKTQT